MLSLILCAVRTKESTVASRILSRVRDRVELMVAHDYVGVASVKQLQKLIRTAVDVADDVVAGHTAPSDLHLNAWSGLSWKRESFWLRTQPRDQVFFRREAIPNLCTKRDS